MTRTSLIVLDCEGGGEGHGAIVLPPPQAEQVVVGSKYAESVTDWKTYSSLSLGKLPPGQSLSREDLMIKTLKEKTTKTPWSTKYYPGAAEFECFFDCPCCPSKIYSLRTVRKQCTSYSQLLGYF